LRYSPAGVPILQAQMQHLSEQVEAQVKRKVELEVNVVAAGPLALQLDQLALGQMVKATGFLAPRRKLAKSLVFHITEFDRG
jgi:primosomal replication protein N